MSKITRTSGYQPLDEVASLERQVENLLILTSQQANTIKDLQAQSDAKSSRLLELQSRMGGDKAAVAIDSVHVLRPKMHLASDVAKPFMPTKSSFKPSSKPNDSHLAKNLKTAEQKIQQLTEERDFWRRHFELTDNQLAKTREHLALCKEQLAEAKVSLDTGKGKGRRSSEMPLKELQINKPAISVTPEEDNSEYVKQLLRENFQLKTQVEKMSLSTKEDNRGRRRSSLHEPASNDENTMPGRQNGSCAHDRASSDAARRQPTQPARSSRGGGQFSRGGHHPPQRQPHQHHRSHHQHHDGHGLSPQQAPCETAQSDDDHWGHHGHQPQHQHHHHHHLSHQHKSPPQPNIRPAGNRGAEPAGRSRTLSPRGFKSGAPRSQSFSPQRTRCRCCTGACRQALAAPTQGSPLRGLRRGPHPSHCSDGSLERIHHLAQHNQCLQKQVEKLKAELEDKAKQISRGHCHHPRVGSARPPHKKGPPRGQHVSGKSGNPRQPTTNASCFICDGQHPCQTSGRRVRFEEEFDPSSVHLCNHVVCLQRQVCHLQLRLNQAASHSHSPPSQNADAGRQLDEARAELGRLRRQHTGLLDQRKEHQERIASLQHQLDALSAASSSNSAESGAEGRHKAARMRELIRDIEQQRDRYKTSVEQLIFKLKRGGSTDERPTVVQQSEDRFGGAATRSTEEDPIPSQQFQPTRDSRRMAGQLDLGLGHQHVEAQLKLSQEELASARSEIAGLRQELMNCLSLLRVKEKETQTTPRDNNAGADDLQLVRSELVDTKEKWLEARKVIEEQKIKLREYEVLEAALQKEIRLLKDAAGGKPVPAADDDHRVKSPVSSHEDCHKEIGKLKGTVEYLEKQLARTENALVTYQNLHASGHVLPMKPTSMPAAPAAGAPGSSQPAGGGYQLPQDDRQSLQKRNDFLEAQLEQTENALRTNQNLVSQASQRTYELNSQLVQLKQELNEALRARDELRVHINNKEEVVARIAKDKEELFEMLNLERDRTTTLKTEVAQLRAKVQQLEQDGATNEMKLTEAVNDLRQRERHSQDRDKDKDRLSEELGKVQESLRSLRLENSQLRQDLEAIRRDTEDKDRVGKDKDVESRRLKEELQRYIHEVRQVEDLLEKKEQERRDLVREYQELAREQQQTESANRSLEMRADSLMLEVQAKETDLEAAKARCDNLQKYLDEITRQNEQFQTQIITLNTKVDMLSSDLKENRITRDSVFADLEGVNKLAVKLNTDKMELLGRIGHQNQEVEKLQDELVKLREELLGAMAELEEERHRARTLQKLVTSTHTQETRETVIKELERSKAVTLLPTREQSGSKDGSVEEDSSSNQ